VPIRIIVARQELEMEALLDTGFDGWVAMPSSSIPVGIPPDSQSMWQMADGSQAWAQIYRGMMRIGDMEPFRGLITILGSEALLGREICDRFLITLDHGKRIIVRP
jgi:predicted aspartyl protease